MLTFKVKAILILLSLGCIVQNRLLAQSNPYVPTIVPPSPEAAALFKFIDVPVSPYTGTTDVTVPIYTIQARGVSIPISIDYHTSGIRLKEESGLVGLGWALNAGGCISRTVMDKDDFNLGASTYFTPTVPQLQGDLSGSQPDQGVSTLSGFSPTSYLEPYVFDFFCNDLVNFSTGQADYSAVFTTTGPSTYDLEPDIFSYSFAGRSGKFIITRDRRVILQKQDNIRIQFEPSGNSFTITDDKGNVFYFYDKAYIQSAALASSPVSSWNLSKIITQQKDSILFTYYGDPVAEYVGPDYTEVSTYFSGVADGHQITNGAGTYYGNEMLQTIDFNSGRLQFYYDNNRSDLKGGKKLDSVLLFSKNTSGFQYARQFNFFYTYFNNSSVASDSFETKRLRLDSVKQSSGALSVPPYAFSYNIPGAANLLTKHGYSTDHWGYYNGTPNSGSIPSLSLYYDPPGNYTGGALSQFFSYSGANRDPSFPFMSAFSLSQIKYPTGGKTMLEYEPNDYDALNSQNGPVSFLFPKVVTVQQEIAAFNPGDTKGTIDLSRIYPSLPANSEQANLTVLITFRASDNAALQRCMQSDAATFSFNGKDANDTENMSSGTASGSVSTITLQVPIHAGTPMVYTWDANITPSAGTDFQDIRVTFQYDTVQLAGEPVGPGNNYAKMGGGLRVRSVTDYSDDVTIAKKRRFEYNYSTNVGGVISQYSYGKLMSHPSYARYQALYTGSGNVNALTLLSSSYTPLSSSISGNIIGYSQVNEYTIDPVTNADIGKTVYTYFNSPDSAVNYHGYEFPGILTMGNNLNGFTLSRTEYANTGTAYSPVSAASYNYHTTNRAVYFSPKYQATGQTGGSAPGAWLCTIGTGVDEQMLCFYPSIKSEKVLLDNETQVAYDQQNGGNAVTTTKSYYYDNPVHYQLTRTHANDSKGNLLTKFNKYPQDYIPNGSLATGNTILDSLIGRNMVSEVIEQRDSLYYAGSSTGLITGSALNTYRLLPNNTFGQDKSYRLDVPSPISDFQPFTISENTAVQDSRYRQMISFDGYDPSGNITQYTSFNQGPESFLWDYLHTYPIAQVTNADSASIAYTSFEADGTGNWIIGPGTITGGGITGNNYYTLSGGATISKAGLSAARNYLVTYWSKAGPLTISGTTAVAGLAKRGWTFYQHTLPAGSTSVSISGTGIGLDELRLYPTDAQMSTLTYTPLIGQNTACSANNAITYYEYDSLGRLKDIKDMDGNVIKTYEYHYKQQ